MKKGSLFSLFLFVYLCACLLAACAASKSGPAAAELPAPIGPSVLLSCRVVHTNGDTLLLAKEDGGYGDVYTLSWDDEAIRSGDLVEITFSGSIQESFPAGLCDVTAVRVLDTDFDNLCDLYIQVIEDLWKVDSALSENISYIGLDLAATSLTPAEQSAIAWHLSCEHNVEYVQGTLEELIDSGYITGEPLGTEDAPSDAKFWHWEDGCHFTVTEQPVFGAYSLSTLSFDAQKWRSSLGAYFFSDCTAVQSESGEWGAYSVGAEMIS